MKRLLKNLFHTLVVFFIIVLIGLAGKSDFESLPVPPDHQIGTLVEIDNDCSIFEGKWDGQLWAVKDCLFQYSIGTQFHLDMDRKGTVLYDDDEITSYRYLK